MWVIITKWWIIKLFKTFLFVQYHEKSINKMYIASPLWCRRREMTSLGQWLHIWSLPCHEDAERSAWGTRWSHPLFTSMHLMVHYTEDTGRHCTEDTGTINFCIANNDSRQIAESTNTSQFLTTAFILIKIYIDTHVRVFFSSVYIGELLRINIWEK